MLPFGAHERWTRKGMRDGSIGQRTSTIRAERIASTGNTLLLAYAGASMPLLLLFTLSELPLGIVANSEVVAIEIVRTLVGSIGLVAAVPVTACVPATQHRGVRLRWPREAKGSQLDAARIFTLVPTRARAAKRSGQ